MANGSCLDDEGRKNKTRGKQELSLQTVGEHPLLPFISQLGRVAAAGGAVRRKHSVPDALPAARRPFGVHATGPDAGNGRHRGCSAQSLLMPEPSPKNGRQQTENHSDPAAGGFPWQPTVSPAAPHPLLFL
jgi:hypothetical protein